MDKSNSDIAMFLERTANLMELHGDNPFKVRSYRTARATVDDVQSSLAELARTGGAAELQAFPGIGKAIAAHIAEFVESGTSTSFERIREEIPESALELLVVRGIGMKMATTLSQTYGVLDLEDLRRFAEGGGLEAIPGLGDKTIARLESAVAAAARGVPRVGLEEAERVAAAIVADLGAVRPDVELVVAGEVRRRRERVSRIDLLAVVDGDPAGVVSELVSLASVGEPLVATGVRAEVTTAAGIVAALRTARPEARAVALVRATGSARHVRQLQERAEELGLALREDGLYDLTAGATPERIPVATEEALYARLGVAYVPPEAREGIDEVVVVS